MSIDYGMGKTNIDVSNGIRYGVISQHSILQVWADSSEADYGEPSCPTCGSKVENYGESLHGDYTPWRNGSCTDYACEECNVILDIDDATGDEPIGWYVDDGEYQACTCLDSDVIVTKSPYYTFVDFCSPCVPGAGNLNSFTPAGVKSYCFNHDWFEDGKAPHKVYRVDNDQEVLPCG